MGAHTARRRREETRTLNRWTRTSIHLTLQSDCFEIVDKIKKAVLYLCIHVYIYIIYIHTHSYSQLSYKSAGTNYCREHSDVYFINILPM